MSSAISTPQLPPETAATPQSAALTPEQLQVIAQARQQGRKVNRAAGVATFSGWTMAVFAFITLLTGLFSIVSLLLGVGLGVVAYVELRGARRLRAFDDTAPFHLGYNQLFLGALICLYCIYGIWKAVAGPSPYDSYLAAGGSTAEMIEPIDNLNRAIMAAFYGLLLCGSAAAQGFGALYYFTRRRHVRDFVTKTPEWVIDMLRVVAR